MKRTKPWSASEESSSSSEESSSSDKEESKDKKSQGKFGKRKKSGAIDFDELRKHGYKGGLSVLNVPPPKDDTPQDWTWSTGKDHHRGTEEEESFEERQKTRAAIEEGELLANVKKTNREKKSLSFSQKEKRKRDLGQASRGKNYVEEEKRLLRDSGVYSSFDT